MVMCDMVKSLSMLGIHEIISHKYITDEKVHRSLVIDDPTLTLAIFYHSQLEILDPQLKESSNT